MAGRTKGNSMSVKPETVVAEAAGLARQGRGDDAEAVLRRADESWTGDGRIAFELAAMLHDRGRHGEAEAAYRRALDLEPAHAGAITNLGCLLAEKGRAEEAEQVFEKALALPTGALGTLPAGALGALEMLATLRDSRGGDAREVWAAIAAADPRNVNAWTQLGVILRGKRPEEALHCFANAVAADPYNASVHCNLGVAYLDLGRVAAAADAFRNALALKPDYSDALMNLAIAIDSANTSQMPELVHESIALYRKVLERTPESSLALFNLASAYKRLGRIEEARACCRRADEGREASGLSVREALLAHRIYPSMEAMLDYRRQLVETLDRLQKPGFSIPDPARQVGETGFGLAYHNLNDVEIQRRIADFYRATVPGLEFVAPHCLPSPQGGRRGERKSGKLRLGIVGSYLHNRTLDNLNEGLIRNLSRDRLDIVFFRPGGVADDQSDALDRLVDKVRRLPGDLSGARAVVAEEELDALFYFEIGMVAQVYFLAFSRLAPVQCVTWGHPDTTGIPAMDYFLSSRLLEPDDGDSHYSETLIRLKHLPTCYPRPPVDEVPGDRARLGLPPSAHVYICPQNLMKFHPDFDRAVCRILTEDPDGHLFITTSAMGAWKPALHQRMALCCPEVADRITFLPQMPRLDFMNLLKVADVNLDPFHFSGGNSTHEALALGSPVVTLPGDFMRGRVSLGLYRRMGYEELVCADVDDYVAKALRLARDEKWRGQVQDAIRGRSAILFDNIEMVREFEAFIAAAVAAAGRGEKLTSWDFP